MGDIDSTEIERRIRAAVEAPATKKGPALERIVADVFAAIPGLTLLRARQKNVRRAAEIDLAFRNEGVERPLEQFGSVVLVECKNQKEKVSSPDVAWFAGKLRDAQVPVGVLVTLSGVAGDPKGPTAALSELDNARIRGRVIIVVERDELEAVDSGERLAAALEHKRLLMQIYGRHEVAARADLRTSGVKILRGFDAMKRALRDERDRIVEEVASDDRPAFASRSGAARAVRSALSGVSEAVSTARADKDGDPLWDKPRAALVELCQACMGFLDLDDDWGGVSTSAWSNNISLYTPQRLWAPAGGRLWDVLGDYFVEEMEGKEERDGARAAFALIGLAVEQIAALDNYQPEPEDYDPPNGW